MDDYVFVPHHGAVQGPPDSPGMWIPDADQQAAHAEKWGGGNAANDNVPTDGTAIAPLMYDPPSGWQYGFPKPYAPTDKEGLVDTLVRDGYPRQMAEDFGAKHCRFFGDNTRPVAPATRRGGWIQTFSGRQFWPMDPLPEEIFIEDIAHSLAMQCRFAGHCRQFYSVAEHSVLVADWLLDHYGKEAALWGLLHDACEAYLVDVPRPVKPFLAGYKQAERAVLDAVCERFGLPCDMPAEVHEADGRILWDEKAQNLAPCVAEWEGATDPLGVKLQFWSPAFAKAAFLMRFSALTVGAREERRAA